MGAPYASTVQRSRAEAPLVQVVLTTALAGKRVVALEVLAGAATFAASVNGGAWSQAAALGAEVQLEAGLKVTWPAGAYQAGDAYTFTAYPGSTLAANALTTVEAAIEELTAGTSTTLDAVALEGPMARLINAISNQIEKYCRRSFRREERTERYQPPTGDTLILDRIPVDQAAAISVELDGAAVAGFKLVNPARGFLFLEEGWGGERFETAVAGSAALATVPGSAREVLEVTYTAGFVLPKDATDLVPRTLPQDLEVAALQAFAANWRLRQSGYAAADIQKAIQKGFGGLLPDYVLPALDAYKRFGGPNGTVITAA